MTQHPIMKTTLVTLFSVMLWSVPQYVYAQGGLALGAEAPMLRQGMEDVSGRSLSLQDVADRNGLLVIFSCNTCPWVAKMEDQYNQLALLANSNDIGMVALNPNERIRGRGESLAEMKKRAQKRNYNFPYLVDRDHAIADAFGAEQTPEVFLFDANMRLVYHGAISGPARGGASEGASYTQDALQALISGIEIRNKQTSIQGCSIKRTE